jgi:hypothetical protein
MVARTTSRTADGRLLRWLSGGIHLAIASAHPASRTASTTNDHRHPACAATSAATIRPLKPPITVPATYADMAAPTPSFHSSLM